MKIKRNLSTPELKAFWDHAKKAREKVRQWPEWKRNIRLTDSVKRN